MPVEIIIAKQVTDRIIEAVIAAWAEHKPHEKAEFDAFCDQFRRDLINKSGMATGINSKFKGDSMVLGHVPTTVFAYMNSHYDGFFYNEPGAHARFYKLYKKARAKRD